VRAAVCCGPTMTTSLTWLSGGMTKNMIERPARWSASGDPQGSPWCRVVAARTTRRSIIFSVMPADYHVNDVVHGRHTTAAAGRRSFLRDANADHAAAFTRLSS